MFRTLLFGIVAIGLAGGASFGAGVSVGKRGVAPTAQAAAAPGGVLAQTGRGGQGGQGSQAGFTGQGDQGRAEAFGTVDRIEGRTLYVTGPNNQQLKVAVTDQTQVLKQAQGSLADLTPGSRVSVQAQGQPAADGTLAAATVSLVPQGFEGQFGQFAQGDHAAGQQGQRGPSGQPAQGGQSGQRSQLGH